MLADDAFLFRWSKLDVEVFSKLIPPDDPLVKTLELIDWPSFNEDLQDFYVPDRGQPAINPLLMLKLEFLKYRHNLSDRKVIERSRFDILFRFFLDVPLSYPMPDPSSLCRFRGRLGEEGFRTLFDKLVSMARDAGLVKDRLRLKDASHVVANIAVPTTLGLVAQIRDRLLDAASPFDREMVDGFRIEVELVRERTEEQDQTAQLEARVIQLQEILDWVRQIPEPENAEENKGWKRFVKLKEAAAKILQEQRDPKAEHRTRSAVDLECRRGKHGDWYDGYMCDVLMDPDSELITQINVLQAGGDEAKDAVELVRREEAAHGNDIEALSIDGAGFNGEMLHELEDPDGLAVKVFVPPKKEPETELFKPADFEMSVDQSQVTCPAGQTSRYRERDGNKAFIFRFARKQCDSCPLVNKCMSQPGKGAFGRIVRKNNYEKDYLRARERARTKEYQEVRKQHPAIERKINDLMRHHRGRFARYWGLEKVMCQQLMTGFVVNVKRMVALLRAKRIATA